MGDITIDGTSISGVTIDGTDVKEVTIDGTTAWKALGDYVFSSHSQDNAIHRHLKSGSEDITTSQSNADDVHCTTDYVFVIEGDSPGYIHKYDHDLNHLDKVQTPINFSEKLRLSGGGSSGGTLVLQEYEFHAWDIETFNKQWNTTWNEIVLGVGPNGHLWTEDRSGSTDKLTQIDINDGSRKSSSSTGNNGYDNMRCNSEGPFFSDGTYINHYDTNANKIWQITDGSNFAEFMAITTNGHVILHDFDAVNLRKFDKDNGSELASSQVDGGSYVRHMQCDSDGYLYVFTEGGYLTKLDENFNYVNDWSVSHPTDGYAKLHPVKENNHWWGNI
jgi:hypothetical protein